MHYASMYIVLCLGPVKIRLNTNLLKRHNQVLDTRLQVHVLKPQNVLATAVVEGEHLIRLCTTRSILLGQLAGILWEVFADDVDQVLVTESICYNEKSLVASVGDFHSLDVCIGYVSHIYPDEDTSFGDFRGILGLALKKIADSLVRGVERVKRLSFVSVLSQEQKIRAYFLQC